MDVKVILKIDNSNQKCFMSRYPFSNCYKLGFRVTCLLTGQYNTKGYDMIVDVI